MLSKNVRGYAAGKPPRALTKTSVNPATTGSESPGGSVRMASITEYCMDLNVHMRVQTRATRVYHRARVRRGSAASPPLGDPHSASADGSVTPRHAYFAMAHCRLRSMRRPTSPPTYPPALSPNRPRPFLNERREIQPNDSIGMHLLL